MFSASASSPVYTTTPHLRSSYSIYSILSSEKITDFPIDPFQVPIVPYLSTNYPEKPKRKKTEESKPPKHRTSKTREEKKKNGRRHCGSSQRKNKNRRKRAEVGEAVYSPGWDAYSIDPIYQETEMIQPFLFPSRKTPKWLGRPAPPTIRVIWNPATEYNPKSKDTLTRSKN